ncbi:hypothetical protein RNO51_22870, partial [Escherichia coli]|nr:hypothetical protein [Escherichia coli]
SERIPAAAGIVNLRYKSCPEMAGQDHSYVEAKDTREIVDIAKLNAELKTTVSKIDQLRKDIDAIVAEIEGDEVQG